MCSRYSLTSPPEAIRAFFAYRETPNFPARYNIAPTQEIGVVCLDPGRKRRPAGWPVGSWPEKGNVPAARRGWLLGSPDHGDQRASDLE
jgi:putative SOS response-associated peptidase YedK